MQLWPPLGPHPLRPRAALLRGWWTPSFLRLNLPEVEFRHGGVLGDGLAWRFPNCAPRHPPWHLCGPHTPLSSCFAFVAALVPPSRLLFGRPPAPRPLSAVPMSWSPVRPPLAAGMPRLCFRQESAAVPGAGAASPQLRGRWSRGACKTPETGQCGRPTLSRWCRNFLAGGRGTGVGPWDGLAMGGRGP